MMEGELLDTLVKCLQDHDTTIERADLQAALAGENGAAIEIWTKEYLGAETILTKDELSLYSTLQKSGDLEALEASRSLSHERVLSDQELQIAIENLRRSTAMVEKQTETLHIQQDSMSSLVRSNRQKYEVRSTFNKTQHKLWITEFRTISKEVEEILQSLRYQVTELESQRKATDPGLRKTASEILRSDDKLLLSLQKLVSNLEPANSENDDDAKRTQDLCARLIKYTVEDVRCRLDKVYLEALNFQLSGFNGEIAEDTEVTALRGELESLYSEILPVAQMSAEQQYLEPALRAISAQGVQGKHRSQKTLNYISSCLTFLMNRLEALTARFEQHQSHRQATSLLLAMIRAELDIPSSSSPTKGGNMPGPGGGTRRKKSQSKVNSSSPVRPRTARRRSSATSFEDDTPAEEQLLRNLGISLPASVSGSSTSERAVAKIMAAALTERTTKLALHARSVQEGSETAIASALHDAYVTVGQLRESLLSETRFGTVTLMDREVEEAVMHLEVEVEGVKKGLADVDLTKLRERNVSRDDFVERWGR